MGTGGAGEHRVRLADLFDAEIAPHHRRFMAAAGVRAGDRVLDVGCGTGQSTRDAARAAAGGGVVGVDVSAAALAYGRQVTRSEGLRGVGYLCADAQAYPFPPEHFDLGISRFGVMFFADPVAAFANIGRALRPGARLVMLVWQGRDRNEWPAAVRRALAPGTAAPPPAPGSDPFSLGDPAVAAGLLAAAGFVDVAFAEVDEPVYYGPDTATAEELVLGLREPTALLAALEPAAAERARDRLRDLLEAHRTADGVFFGSRAWIITATRGSGPGAAG
ncbi:MAG: class I SAM-dependent methyltransferase [Mycobacteriales bacterium]